MKKWLLNFWYHYKFRTILCIFLALILGVTVFEFVTREKYDIKVYLYLSQNLSSDVERALETTIEQYYSENGKEINVGVINFSYDPYSADGDNRMSHAAALAGELRLKNNFLFITDSYRFEELNTNEVFENAFTKNDLFNKYEKKAYSLKDSRFEKIFIENLIKNGIQPTDMPELFISLLSPPDKNNDNYSNYKAAKDLAEKIIKSN